ncbi:uncharacterized protein LOC141647352 [Silene latifolia]|uniref:uncharacterized protein LOC141647352 n=1 Tax=Silene latifolia TaxID=37657 RepID=UPI003D786A0F
MNFPSILCPLFFIFAWTQSTSVSSQCLDDEKSLLLQLRIGLNFNHSFSTKLVTWNQTKDCCKWSGIQCNNTNNRVIGLDLSNEAITRGIDNLSPLFHLKNLQTLNLAYNPVLGYIPSAIGNLSSLTYLNLSHTSFKGQVPLEISQLFNLVILDISMQVFPMISPLFIKNPNLEMIFRNLTNVRELYLDGIAILAKGDKWGEQISSSLPRLQVLSMAGCNLTGGIHHSLAKLGSLSVISLDFNNLAAQVPDFLAGFTNLTVLTMNDCGLTGTFPKTIFEVPTLITLAVQANQDLQGSLPHSISKKMKNLDLAECSFQGSIPPSIGSLKELESLDLSYNNFSGTIPSFSSAKYLNFLELSNNSLSGTIPSSVFSKDSDLQFLDLSFNSLEGPIPESIFQVTGLGVLDLGWNRLNGTLHLHEILPLLANLDTLELSHNYLTIDTEGVTTDNSSLPLLGYLGLASGNLHAVPEFIENQPYLWNIDLSNNQIQGRIPRWVWKDNLYQLNLSRNNFVDLKIPSSAELSNLQILDLHSNNLQGQLPSLPSVAPLQYLDLSNNSFVTTINRDIGNFLSSAQFISLAGNNIYGSIPESLCNASILQVLDLSDNDLNGTIPVCLIKMTQSLAVLNLRGNALHGAIPDEFGENCTLETLNFNMNAFHGKLPGSLAKCKSLKVLDLGNNRLTDTFPCHLKSISSLQVLVLRSNQLHGSVICPRPNSLWPLLQIIDLASNHFSGQPSKLFFGKSMMTTTNGTNSKANSVQYYNRSTIFQYYRDEVTVTYKGFEFQLQKILTIFTSIDLSSNDFHGNLPKELGNMNALKVLNLSHNGLSGEIPRSIGNLSQLESLDLCCNSLTGHIPQQLASLSFLGYLNLSFNNLVGQIPTSTQLQSFDPSSYEGNPGLYNAPITPAGKIRPGSSPSSLNGSHWSHKSEVTWMLSGAAVGYALGITVFFGPLLCIKRLRDWYNYHVDILLMKVLPSKKKTRSKKTGKKHTHRK